MIKKSMNSGLAGYSAPCCKFVAVSAKKLICASNYGESGYAGGVFNSGNTNTYDGDDDLL